MRSDNREEYLEAIYSLIEDGKSASTNLIASAVGVKPASATQMLKKLHLEGYITRKPYKGVALTRTGLEAAAKLKRKHRLLERFLHDVLKISIGRVHGQACKMEHSLSDEAADALDRLMKHPKVCPDDRKPIPKALDGAKKTLIDAMIGSLVRVDSLEGGDSFQNRMRAIGVREGKALRVVAREPFGGPIVVKSGNTSVTIGRGMASKIRVA
ncbi:MAG: metal-dependent transcriptional regulator [Candidatus Altiarchaeota archaeon]